MSHQSQTKNSVIYFDEAASQTSEGSDSGTDSEIDSDKLSNTPRSQLLFELDNAKGIIRDLQANLDKTTAECHQLRSEIAHLIARLNSLDSQCTNLHKLNSRLDKKQQAYQAKFMRISNRLHTLLSVQVEPALKLSPLVADVTDSITEINE